MANKKIVISGGEYGRPPEARDMITGEKLWSAPGIIDDGCIMLETPLGNIFIADDENRCTVLSKDGVVIRTDGFVYDTDFTDAVKTQLLIKYPDATFGTHDGSGRLAYTSGSISSTRDRQADTYSSPTIHLGGTKFFTRLRNFSFGQDAAGVSIPEPANWQTPFGAIFDYNADTGVYTNLVLVGDNTTVTPTLNSDASCWFLGHTAANLYYMGWNGSYQSMIHKIVKATGAVETTRVYADADMGFNTWTDSYSFLVRMPQGPDAYFYAGTATDTGIMHVKNLDSLFTRTAPVAGAGFIFDDRADFDTATALIEYIPTVPYSTNFTVEMTNNMGPLTANSFFGNSYSCTQVGTMIYVRQSYPDVAPSAAYVWGVFSLNMANGEMAWLNERSYPYVRYVIPFYGETNTESPSTVHVEATHIYFHSDAGWHRANRATGLVENLFLVSDDDEDWTNYTWIVEWPTFEIPCAVTSPDTSDVADVMLYDETSGQYLRTVTVNATATINCYTTAHKFAVCKSPDEATNYKISAHIIPTPTA